MSKHTPGPWEVAYKDKNGQLVVKGEHIEIATCWHHCVVSIEKEMKYNASLIASAPELYALAERIARLNKDAGEIGAGMLAGLVDEANRIIAKVEQ